MPKGPPTKLYVLKCLAKNYFGSMNKKHNKQKLCRTAGPKGLRLKL